MNKIVIVAGSGVSVDAPANLPSWWEYNKALIAEIKRQVLLLCPEAEVLLESLDVEKGLPVQCVSDIIVQGGAGSSYFPLLKLLDGSTPNANHLAMVELAKTGQLDAIVTTNFDTLIEECFKSEAVPLNVLFADDDFTNTSANNACRLMKVHGSVVDEKSLIDTVTQKSRGLTAKKKLASSGAMFGADVVVMGFSGADLDFGQNYIPFESALEQSGSVTWLCRPGSDVHPAVRSLADAWRGGFRIVEQDLRGFFIEHGVSYDDLVDKASRRAYASLEKNGKLVDWADAEREIRELFSEPHLGPHACTGYCITMLSSTGRFAEAKELAEIYESKLDLQKLDILSVNGLYSLAMQKAAGGDFSSARRWMTVAMICLQKMHSIAEEIASSSEANAGGVESGHILEHCSNMAAAYLNRGVYAEKDGDLEASLNDLDCAQKYAELCGNTRVLGSVAYGKVRARFASDNDYDVYIVGLRECKELIKSSGNMRGLAEVLIDECQAHLMLGEYAIAKDVLENSSIVLRNVGDFNLKLRQLSLEVDLAIRKREEREALVAMESLVSAVEEASSTEWACSALLLLTLGFRYNESTANILRRLAEIARFDSVRAIEKYRSFDANWWYEENQIPAWIVERIPEDDLRNKLVACEYRHHEALSAVLHVLCRKYVARCSWARLLDLSFCYLRAATTADATAKARYYTGCAYLELGEFGQAEDEFKAVLNTREEVDPAFINWAHAELAKLYVTQGNFENADVEYRAILGANSVAEPSDVPVEMCMAYIQHLTRCRRWEDAKEKAEELLGMCTVDQKNDIRPVFEMIVREVSREERSDLELKKMSPEDIATYANRIYEESGDAARACDLLLVSKRGYERRDDVAGVAKCENNLANILVKEGRYEEAKQHFMESVRINDDSGLERVAMRQLAQAISLQAYGVNASGEIADAILRVSLHPTCPEKSLLLLSLYHYYFFENKPIEAYTYARQVLEHEDHFVRYGAGYISEIDASVFEKMKQFVSLVESCFRQTPARVMPNDDFLIGLSEATRLYHLGDFEASYALLDELAKNAAHYTERLGRVIGTRGNALLQEGKYGEAEKQFREAIALFDEAAQQGEEVSEARLNAFNSLFLALDSSGRTEESIKEMEGILSVQGVCHNTFSIAINLCNRLFEKHRVWEKGDQVYTRIRGLLDELRGIEGLSFEESGTLAYAYGNLSFHAFEMEDALDHFEEARHFFTNANSSKRVAAEKMIEAITETVE